MTETPTRPPDQHHTAADLLPPRARRFASLLAAVAVGVALFGFLTGIREPGESVRPTAPPPATHGDAPAAVNYAELPTAKLRPDAGRTALAQLVYERPAVTDPVVRTEEMKLAALADRRGTGPTTAPRRPSRTRSRPGRRRPAWRATGRG